MENSEKNYTVIAYSVGGINNIVYKSGDEVKESNFPPGNAEKLVSQGFLKRFTKSKQTKAEKAAAAKALKASESNIEEANMAVTIEQEKIDDLKSKLDGDDIDDKVKGVLEHELAQSETALEIANEVLSEANEKLASLNGK